MHRDVNSNTAEGLTQGIVATSPGREPGQLAAARRRARHWSSASRRDRVWSEFFAHRPIVAPLVMLPAVLMVAAVAVGFMEVGKDNNRSRPRGRRDILAYRFVGRFDAVLIPWRAYDLSRAVSSTRVAHSEGVLLTRRRWPASDQVGNRRRCATPVITSTFENVSDKGV